MTQLGIQFWKIPELLSKNISFRKAFTSHLKISATGEFTTALDKLFWELKYQLLNFSSFINRHWILTFASLKSFCHHISAPVVTLRLSWDSAFSWPLETGWDPWCSHWKMYFSNPSDIFCSFSLYQAYFFSIFRKFLTPEWDSVPARWYQYNKQMNYNISAFTCLHIWECSTSCLIKPCIGNSCSGGCTTGPQISSSVSLL